jgi:EmrB/QacA subfamily drug resistance transporter
MTLALLCIVNFMVILDAQIVILALPSVEADLGFAPGASQWVMSAYLLTFGGLLLLGGRAGDLLGRRRVLLAGTALFLLASLACGLAWSGDVLVAARAVHGVSAALMAPTALAILMTTFAEGPGRNRALAIWGGFGGFGATAALLIGGSLTEWLGWEAIFLLNVPVAVLILALAPRVLAESRATGERRSFDLAGAVSITATVALLILAVVEAPDAGWLTPQTLVLLAAAAAALAAFVAVERRAPAPLAPLAVFRMRTLAGGNLVMLLAGMAAWGVSLVASLYGQDVLGMSPLEFGLGTVALTLTAVAGSYAAQAAVSRVGPGRVAATGCALLATGAALLTQVSADGGYLPDLFWGLLVFGAGLGAATVAASIAALTGVADRYAGVASGMNMAAFQIGGALGAAIVTTVLVSATDGTDAVARTDGFQAGFLACVALAAAGLAIAVAVLTERASAAPA